MSWYRESEAWLPAWAVLDVIYRPLHPLQVRSVSDWASVWKPFECREPRATLRLTIPWWSYLQPPENFGLQRLLVERRLIDHRLCSLRCGYNRAAPRRSGSRRGSLYHLPRPIFRGGKPPSSGVRLGLRYRSSSSWISPCRRANRELLT